MKGTKTITVVARQAGTATAFLPLFGKWREGDIRVRSFAFPHAHKVFAASGVDCAPIEGFHRDLLGDLPCSLLLTGTSEFAEEDHLFWQWAKERGVPSLAFVDSWVSYWERFTPAGAAHARFSCTPDTIAVIDQLMHDRMVESGCDDGILAITGSPAFDGLRSYLAKEREAIAAAYGEGYFLFVGEPFNGRICGGSEKEARGYTEAEVLRMAADAVEMLGEEAKLVFRPHPRGGHGTEVASLIEHRSGVLLRDGGQFASRDLVACAKGVVGMTSMLLYEASVMGVPAVSLQPNMRQPSDLIECSKIPVVVSPGAEEACRAIRSRLRARRDAPPWEKSRLWEEICLRVRDR